MPDRERMGHLQRENEKRKREELSLSLSLSLSLRSVLSKSQRSDSFCSLTCRQAVKVDEGGDMESFRCIGGQQRKLYQGLASPRLNWYAPEGRGHGVPVLGGDGYEYVRSRNRKS